MTRKSKITQVGLIKDEISNVNDTESESRPTVRRAGMSGLVVIGEVMGSNPGRRILDGNFFTLLCCKNCIVFEKTENQRKRGRGWPI